MFKYTSFISYSRAADSRLAPELKSALQNFAKPWYKLRAIQVFCDQTNLTANPDLWSAIEVSLQSSEHFIYLASPQAAQSKWVKKELEAFAGMRSPNIIMVLTDGAILWDDIKNDFDWNSTTAVPKFDQALFSHEPTWIDLTWIRKEQLTIRDPRFLDAVANLSSVLRRIDKDVLIGKDVEEHKKVKRFRLFSIVGLCLLAIFLMAATVVAVLSERRSQQRLVTTFAGNGNAMLEADDFVMAIPWYVEAMANDRDNNHIEMHETRVRNFMNAVPGLQQVWHTDLPVLKTFFAGNTKLIIISGEPIDWGINEFTCFTNNNGICRVQLQMVDQQTGNEIFKPIKALDGLRQAAINENGNLLATISVANVLRLYNLQSGKVLWDRFLDILPSGSPDAGIIQFNKEGNSLLALTQNKLVVCNTTNGSVEGVFPLNEGQYAGKAFFLEDGKKVLVLNEGLRVWDLQNKTIKKLATPFLKEVSDVVLSPDYRQVAIAGFEKDASGEGGNGRSIVAVADINKLNDPLFTDRFESMGLKMMFSNEGSMLAVNSSVTTEGGSSDFGTRIYYAKTGETVIPWIKMTYEVNIRFGNKGNDFILTCDDGTTQIWKLPASDEQQAVYRKILLHDGNTGQPSIVSNNNFLITVSDQRLVKLWKLPAVDNYYEAIPNFLSAEQEDTLSWYVATGSINDTVKLDSSVAIIMDRKTDKPIGKPIKANAQIYQTFVSPDGKIIAITAKDGVSVWRKDNQERLYKFPVANSSGISSIAFSKDGKKILTGHFDYAARVWDAATGKPLTPFMRQPFSASLNDNLVTYFSNDNKKVITKDYDTYRVWDAVTGQPVSTPIKADYKYEALINDTTVKKRQVKANIPSVKNLSKEALKLYGELLSNNKIDETGAVISLTEDEYALKWQEWKNMQKPGKSN